MSDTPNKGVTVALYALLVVVGLIGCGLMWALPPGSVVAGLVYGKF